MSSLCSSSLPVHGKSLEIGQFHQQNGKEMSPCNRNIETSLIWLIVCSNTCEPLLHWNRRKFRRVVLRVRLAMLLGSLQSLCKLCSWISNSDGLPLLGLWGNIRDFMWNFPWFRIKFLRIHHHWLLLVFSSCLDTWQQPQHRNLYEW